MSSRILALVLTFSLTGCARAALEPEDAGTTDPSVDTGTPAADDGGEEDSEDAGPSEPVDPSDSGAQLPTDSGNPDPQGDGDGDPDAGGLRGSPSNSPDCPDVAPATGDGCNLFQDPTFVCRYGSDEDHVCTCAGIAWGCF